VELRTVPRPVLVTGASGFLGETLLRRLAERGIPAVGTSFTASVSVPRADVIPVDLRDSRAVHRLVRDLRPSAVFHAAALTDPAFCEREPESARAANLDATAHLAAEVAAQAPRTPFVFLSTDLVFDGRAAPYAPGAWAKPLSVYGSLKYMAEAAALALPLGVVVRTALLFGPPMTRKQGFLGWMRGELQAGRPLTLFEDEFRTPLCTLDLSDGLIAAVERGLAGLFHAGGPERLSRLRMGEVLCEEAGLDAGLLRRARVSEFQGSPPRPADVSLDARAFWQATALSPRPFREGIRQVLAAQPLPKETAP
jgi:dTDP-4-dehydrorhamnose reductase